MSVHGYTTLMSPEAMKLPYLEALLSWSRLCDTLTVCYSRFPKLNIDVPEGAVKPWEDDGSLDILEKFNREMLDNKLEIVMHDWDISEPREDGVTKQISRVRAGDRGLNDSNTWLAQFDADEILTDKSLEVMYEFLELEKKQPRTIFATAGIIEFFGSNKQVRFGFGNWIKIRLFRNSGDIIHGMPLWARDRNPNTGKIIAKNNADDGAGILFKYTLNRPDLNQGAWLFNPKFLQYHQAAMQRQVPLEELAKALNQEVNNGAWIYHTSWIDIPRKWSMGWFFDNFWSVLNGKQDTFIEKAKEKGSFTHTRIPSNLEEELKRELNRPEIQPVDIQEPGVFDEVIAWRQKASV